MNQKRKDKILIIDDDKDILLTSKVVLKHLFDFIRTESDPFKLQQILREDDYDVILLDMNFSTGATSGKEGIYWLKKIIDINPNSNVIMITAYADLNRAVEAMKIGAIDFVIKPWDNEKLIATLNSALRLSKSKQEIRELKSKQRTLKEEINKSDSEMIGESQAIKSVFESIKKISQTNANVLILGENGTGKELVARAIHKNSLRSDQIFVNVDLGAISESLFESELFGHKKGSFTDASNDRAGRFEIASGGSIFLDEIGNLSFPLQAKLLSVLENRKIIRLGDNKEIPIDIRLISATNMPLHNMIEENSFRQDLLYRINTVEITLPPLRERKEDIPLLVELFVNKYSEKYQKKGIKISKDATRKLIRYKWPGNIRELKHLIERAIIMCDGNKISSSDFLINSDKNENSIKSNLNIEELEKNAIKTALKKHNGNLSKAAKELGLGRTTLYRKMSKYDL